MTRRERGVGAPFMYSQAVLAFCFQTPTKAKEHPPIVGKHPPTPPFLLSSPQHTPSRMSPGAICVWHTVCHRQNTHTCKMNHVYALSSQRCHAVITHTLVCVGKLICRNKSCLPSPHSMSDKSKTEINDVYIPFSQHSPSSCVFTERGNTSSDENDNDC